MPYYTAQVTIPTADNLAANYATNTFHFEALDDSTLSTVTTTIKAAYALFHGRISNLARTTGWSIKFYDDEDPEPRAPVYTESWNPVGMSGVAGLPPEVALCCSFQGVPISGTPQARRRGRVYLPFLVNTANGTDGRPTSAVITDAVAFGNKILDDSLGTADWSWVTYSSVAPGYATVTNGWVDNEFDTQRRRGRVATSRSVFS